MTKADRKKLAAHRRRGNRFNRRQNMLLRVNARLEGDRFISRAEMPELAWFKKPTLQSEISPQWRTP